MKRLGVNIDHIATLRNARGEKHPSPVYASNFVKKAGAVLKASEEKDKQKASLA